MKIMQQEVSMADKILRWLAEEGLQLNKIADSENDANIAFWPNPQLKMHAILKKDKISVVIRVLLTDRGQKAFSSRKDKQSRFLNDLCFALNQQIPEFQINYSKHNEFNGVQITKHIWSEALTKTSFFDSVPGGNTFCKHIWNKGRAIDS